MAENTVKFKAGTQARYDELVAAGTVEAVTLYFCTDTEAIYKGTQRVAKTSALFVSALPAFNDAIENVIYAVVEGTDINLYIKNSVLNSSELIWVGGSTIETSKVKLSNQIVTTIDVGNIKKGTTIDVTDLQTFLTDLLSSDSWGTVTQPRVTLTTANNIAYEVGTKVTPTYSATFSAGSYAQTAAKDQVATDVTTKIWTVNCTGQTAQTDGTAEAPSGKTTISGSFDEITVVDNSDVAVTVSVTHTAGAEPKSYLGKDKVGDVTAASKAIKAGAVSDTNNTKITGYRKSFYYVGTDHTSTINSAFVREGSPTSTTSASNNFNVDTATDAAKTKSLHIPAGTTRVMLAVPGTKTLSSVIDVLGMGLDVVSNFTSSTVQVAGADGTNNLKDYTIFETVNANGLAETYYAITIA